MELVFTVIAIVLVGTAYLLLQHFRGGAAQCRRPIGEWLSSYQARSPVEQHEMAEMLLRRSIRLAANMGVQINLDELLGNGAEPADLIAAWQVRLPGVIPAAYLPGTPASTVGALLLIQQVDPSRFHELLGQSAAG
ncbi:hypothetical protein M2262_002572 [Pseudomonas sp. BIGb0408]|uniref:Uncharacterized protein n=1 Tax=Phytopseudomonas flavescens TaxID=29435 RepID=A0A7Z0BMV7_9GAMM|nr:MULTISPECIES: hypothetical protein [Pseudomonas]MCW2292522.1 hypothetical protein [Pseudomonas sp. BIGb0408]NYH72907.1 hypothetical protein [Pseudomonas flavescens]